MFAKCEKYLFFSVFFYIAGLMTVVECKMDNITQFAYNVYCRLQSNSYDCAKNGTITPKFYYDIKLSHCRTTVDGGCKYNYNAFPTLDECHNKCTEGGWDGVSESPFFKIPNPNLHMPTNLTANIFCRLQPDFGKCDGYKPMFYYDVSQRQCIGFSFSGCGGNYNRFENAQVCKAVCIPLVEY